jgi:hypothetical protein
MTAKAARNERKGFLAGRVSRLVGCLAGQQDTAILGAPSRYRKSSATKDAGEQECRATQAAGLLAVAANAAKSTMSEAGDTAMDRVD